MHVDELLKDYGDGRLAAVMQQILNEDIPEVDMAVSVQSFNASLSSKDILAAWPLLASYERAAWKKFVDYENWLKSEKLRAYQ